MKFEKIVLGCAKLAVLSLKIMISANVFHEEWPTELDFDAHGVASRLEITSDYAAILIAKSHRQRAVKTSHSEIDLGEIS